MAHLLPLVHLLVGELVGDLLVLERAGLLDVALLAAEAALRGERHRAVSDARWAVRCCAVLSGAWCAVRGARWCAVRGARCGGARRAAPFSSGS